MGSVSKELSSEYVMAFFRRLMSNLLLDESAVIDAADWSSRLDDLIVQLENEMRKIDAFKRELPLCMLLIENAINILKSELLQFVAPPCAQPVTAEFIPLKENRGNIEDEGPKQEENSKDESLGTLDLQLCTFQSSKLSPVLPSDLRQDVKAGSKRCEVEKGQYASEDGLETSKSANIVRQFMQSRVFPSPPATVFLCEEDKVELPVHSLSLLTPGIKNSGVKPVSADARANFGRSLAGTVLPSSRSGSQQQSPRKQRRCWSSELHRQFVHALQQLGGAQVATPKQIREHMQVDGLTNDEVKSHLQKYRLHNRRSSMNQSAGKLGSMWLSGDQSDDAIASKGSNSQSGSPQGPLQLGGSAGDVSTTGGDSMEDDDDSKSESVSWKIHVNHYPSPGKVAHV
ncbi:hypothetical protein SAY86_000819 [Trapa natans]|uniref:HTH myb-type domain-containing protein n=1 Tax=Trapa natans TaxID=22666 RepID=A0AAN7MFM0_TRANT|nr:hypothetical protein SAY86_000819 [Trapa natans]